MDETGQESPGPGLPEHPPAALLTCSKKFIDILQTLTPADTLGAGTAKHADTETLLQVLSGYLALMRLFDVLFHGVYQTISKMALLPPVPYEALRVRSVLRIGGVSALQDMPLKAYAVGILEAIYGQMRTIEKYLGSSTQYPGSGFTTNAVSETVPTESPYHYANRFDHVNAERILQRINGRIPGYDVEREYAVMAVIA
ncbi:hypothetical protein Sste5346_003548 [Sporothrix stenoceras]|uniref:C6 zinc finger domain containing protein n=1 Tax=Sporothrix stenoceras TaxID=5173 RepID=A0ABR3ZBU9_9PEZI